MRLTISPVVIMSLALLSGCAARQPDIADLPSRDFAGHLTAAAIGYFFRACGSVEDPGWWVTFVDGAVRQLDAREQGRLDGDQPVFVRLAAAMTDERHVGPGGPALLVRDIVELRAATPTDGGAR